MTTSAGRATGSSLTIRSPATGEVVGVAPVTPVEKVQFEAGRLREAQSDWEQRGPEARATVMRRWGEWFMDNERRLGELVQAESGKAWSDAALEPALAVGLIKHYARHAAAYLAPQRVRPHDLVGVTKRLELRYRPYPLVGLITPWNGPIGAPMLDCVAALMAGAAVLSKPSEVTPLAWLEAVRGFREDVGGPPVLTCVIGDGQIGSAVVDAVDMVMFTGSTKTGRAVAVRCAERLIPCSLELGGKDPMIVLSDADIDRAVRAAVWGAMLNSGQTCVSVERVYVEAPVYDEFVRKATEAVRALRQGTDRPGEFAVEVGAMATAAQADIVERHVADAIARGARVTVGGSRAKEGLYFEPTVLADVDHSMLCMCQETFGPTLPIARVADEDEAVALANDTPYGLSASVFSGNPQRARRIADRIEAGSVNLNNTIVNLFHYNLPQSGWKQSGIGSRFGGPMGLLKFCRPQSRVSERFDLPEPYWYPVSRAKGAAIIRATRLLNATGWRRRLKRAH